MEDQIQTVDVELILKQHAQLTLEQIYDEARQMHPEVREVEVLATVQRMRNEKRLHVITREGRVFFALY